MSKQILIEILQSREDRRDKQIELINKYNKRLISFTLNIPGKIKDNKIYRNIHIEGMEFIIKKLKDKGLDPLYEEEIYKATGPEGYIVVDIEAFNLKKMVVEIEESHLLGRIFDIDVFDLKHNQISRKDLGVNPRPCLLCDNDARQCMRLRNHTLEELIKEINGTWEKYKRMY